MWAENLSADSILKNKLRGKAIYGQEMIKAFRLCKIVLNFIRRQNETSHNMRTFEVPAAGAFLLTQRTQEQASFLFKEDENIACFGNIDELVKKIKFYLKLDSLRKVIAKKGFEMAQHFKMENVLQGFMEKF